MWNDTDIPLAHLITFRCYGTWLHGDERGAVDRFHHRYKALFAPPNERRNKHNRKMLKGAPVLLGPKRRLSVEQSIRATCLIRKWLLHAVSVRTNHVHVFVSVGTKNPNIVLNAFKANATRQMRQDG